MCNPFSWRQAPRPEQFGVPCRRTRRLWVERIGEARRTRHAPSHPRSAEVGVAAKPDQKSGHTISFGSNREPPGCRKVQCLGVAPNLPDYRAQCRAAQPFLHRPQSGAGITRVDMDKVAYAKPGRIDSSRLDHRHPLLHPQQWLAARDMGEQETGRTAVARACRKQLAERRPLGRG